MTCHKVLLFYPNVPLALLIPIPSNILSVPHYCTLCSQRIVEGTELAQKNKGYDADNMLNVLLYL